MSNCNHDCGNCASKCEVAKFQTESEIKNVIGIVSGKGGVGKSLVTALLASEMRRKGFRVSILDADITGPSIPKLFGIHEKVFSDGKLILPAISQSGIKIISMNLCLQNENDPVVWRGPVIAGVIQQFWEDVEWGDTDYMFVDMPPGTGDVPLTVFQSLPVKGIVIVTTPQELVSMIVNKAVKMAELMKIPVLGLVENMSYFECPDCGKRHDIFGESKVEELSIKPISKLPFVSGLSKLCDNGEIEKFNSEKYLNDVINNL